MSWPLETRRTLALAASSIDERLVLVPLAAPAGDEALAERRWKEWMESATAGDPGSFAHALDAERIDATAARRALGIVEYPAVRPLPAWIDDAGFALEPIEVHPSSRRPFAPHCHSSRSGSASLVARPGRRGGGR